VAAVEFNDLKNAIKGIMIETLRVDGENNFEAVIAQKEIEKLTKILEKFFGPPVFPEKKSLSPQISKLIEGFGGILPGQTMYFWDQGKEIIFTMLWPWRDGQHTTLRIFRR
jgi:hypothetical protein